MPNGSELRFPAFQVQQGPNRLLYSFVVDGKLLQTFTTVSRIRRDPAATLAGYQRPEVVSHIAEIRAYLESEDPMLPNAVTVAFDPSVRFDPDRRGPRPQGHTRLGTLVIPFDRSCPEERRPGWIVDGQQRLAAIRESRLESFPICVVGFIAADDQEQKEQFILVNSTKPLPRGLIYELLPTTRAKLPSLLQRRRFPAMLLDRLNHDEGPLCRLIRTPTISGGIIEANSILKMLEQSLSDGVLYRFRDPITGQGDLGQMLEVLRAFWGAVAVVFSDAWSLPPARSRLTHGAGIEGLGLVMDAIADRHRDKGIPTLDQFRRDLEPLRDVCRWTDGYWDFGPGAQRKWNEIQNTSQDKRLLANYLLGQYKALVWSRGRGIGGP